MNQDTWEKLCNLALNNPLNPTVRVELPGNRSVAGMLRLDDSAKGVASRNFTGREKFGVQRFGCTGEDGIAWFLSAAIETVEFPDKHRNFGYSVIIALR